MGMPIIVDVRDEAVTADRPRAGLRLVSRGRPNLQHVQARQRDQPPEPRRAVDPRRLRRRARGAAALRVAPGRDRRRLRRASRLERHRPLGLREGVVGRSRRELFCGSSVQRTSRSTRAGTCSWPAGRCRSRAGASACSTRCGETGWRRSSRARSSRSRRRARTSAGGHVLDARDGLARPASCR